MKTIRSLPLLFVLALQLLFAGESKPVMLVRCDDIGMCHAVNLAAKDLAETGIPLNYSVMFVCPWYQEAVEILADYENICFGVHLAVNSEWKNYRWGPCTDDADVSTLTDDNGYFYHSQRASYAAGLDHGQIEKELRTQIERALSSGLDIRYVDTHMSTLSAREDLQQIVKDLAREYGLIFHRDVPDETMTGIYSYEPKSKQARLMQQLRNLESGQCYLLVSHIGMRGAEMDALIDMNPGGLEKMSQHREAEWKVLSSKAFRREIERCGIKLSTYAAEAANKNGE
jgi:chitin disaccharide deacetylase